MISSSEKSTAAIGVLNAAARAAAQPMGTIDFTCSPVHPTIASDHRRESSTHVHWGSFATEGDAAC
jgi:hypothetical protein